MVRPDRLGEIDEAANAAAAANAKNGPDNSGDGFEGEIREFVRRDVSVLRRAQPALADNADANAAENMSGLISRVSGASIAEVERVIAELNGVRDMLRSEGERVQREIAGYASLSQAAMTSMKIIGDSLAQWKPNAVPPRR